MVPPTLHSHVVPQIFSLLMTLSVLEQGRRRRRDELRVPCVSMEQRGGREAVVACGSEQQHRRGGAEASRLPLPARQARHQSRADRARCAVLARVFRRMSTTHKRALLACRDGKRHNRTGTTITIPVLVLIMRTPVHVSEQPNASPAGWHTAGATSTADSCVALAQLHPIVGWLGSRELTETFRSVIESSAASRLPMRQPAPPQYAPGVTEGRQPTLCLACPHRHCCPVARTRSTECRGSFGSL